MTSQYQYIEKIKLQWMPIHENNGGKKLDSEFVLFQINKLIHYRVYK